MHLLPYHYRKKLSPICKANIASLVAGYNKGNFHHRIITEIRELIQDANITSAVEGHSKTTTTMNRYARAWQAATRKGFSHRQSLFIVIGFVIYPFYEYTVEGKTQNSPFCDTFVMNLAKKEVRFPKMTDTSQISAQTTP